MSSRAPSSNPDRIWVWAVGLVVVLLAGVGLVWAAVTAAAGGAGQPAPGNPFQLLADLGTGHRPWPGGKATVLVIGVPVLLLVAVGAGVLVWRSGSGRRTRVDPLARRMAPIGQLAGITPTDAARTAARLRPGADLADPDAHGLPIGKTVPGGVTIRQGWEDVAVVIAGPRTGKSTSVGIPAIMAAPGAVAATSNKPDLHDATRGPRSKIGTIWSFDPQGVADTTRQANWWWNPLTPVTSIAPARALAQHFVATSRSADARTDAYFDGGAQGLLSTFLLAVALGGGDMLHVLEWLYEDTDLTPALLLEAHGNTAAGARVRSTSNLTSKQKDGLYDGARRFLEVLDEPSYAAWVTPPARVVFTVEAGVVVSFCRARRTHELPEFFPGDFAASTDTLYAMSMEGPESAAALTTALMGQVFEAASRRGATMPGRRLDVPLTVVLDEAANVCRLSELPNLYSHFGSRGIIVTTFLQSAVQGEEVWGERGMRKLWTAANVSLYAGGVRDERWLRELSTLIGDRDVSRWAHSNGRGGSSRSQTWSREPILSVDELMALPRGRGLLLSSGNKATLVRTLPWMNSPHADAVRASLSRWEPAARTAAREQGEAEWATASDDEAPAKASAAAGGVPARPHRANPLISG